MDSSDGRFLLLHRGMHASALFRPRWFSSVVGPRVSPLTCPLSDGRAAQEEEGGGSSNRELRGVLEIEPAGGKDKDKDAGAASSLLGKRQSSSRGEWVSVCVCRLQTSMCFEGPEK